jgi:hypothetical protein
MPGSVGTEFGEGVVFSAGSCSLGIPPGFSLIVSLGVSGFCSGFFSGFFSGFGSKLPPGSVAFFDAGVALGNGISSCPGGVAIFSAGADLLNISSTRLSPGHSRQRVWK